MIYYSLVFIHVDKNNIDSRTVEFALAKSCGTSTDHAASQKSAVTITEVRSMWHRNRMMIRGVRLALRYIATLGHVTTTRDFSASYFLASSALWLPDFFRFFIIIDTFPDFFTMESFISTQCHVSVLINRLQSMTSTQCAVTLFNDTLPLCLSGMVAQKCQATTNHALHTVLTFIR